MLTKEQAERYVNLLNSAKEAADQLAVIRQGYLDMWEELFAEEKESASNTRRLMEALSMNGTAASIANTVAEELVSCISHNGMWIAAKEMADVEGAKAIQDALTVAPLEGLMVFDETPIELTDEEIRRAFDGTDDVLDPTVLEPTAIEPPESNR